MYRKISLFAVALPFVMGCAFASPAIHVNAQQASLIEATCAKIMGLRQGEYYYDACRDSLASSVTARDEGTRMERYNEDCRRQGLVDGSAALSMCILDKQNTAPAMTVASVQTAAMTLSYPQNDPDAGKSYYNVTPSSQWRRKQYSCAQMGFAPSSPAFTHCVASLNADLQSDLP
jgi:hypothetical protein